MIGDLDRLLPTSFPLAHSPSDDTANLERDAGARASDSKLELSDLLIGTRLHRGEGLLIEAYTVSWAQIQVFTSALAHNFMIGTHSGMG